MNAIIDSYDEFQKHFYNIERRHWYTAVEMRRRLAYPRALCTRSCQAKREPNMKTLRQIIKTIKRLQNAEKGDFIAVIAARPVLDNIRETKEKDRRKPLYYKGISATSIEEAIIAAVKAEREGACALVCAPIVSSTV
jgi:predicted transcriptional regulator